MITLFKRRGRILFFPKKWANAVVRWIAGVHSPTGTIMVKNTMSPGDDGSLELDVNMDAVAAETARRMDARPMTQDERSRFEAHLRGRVDGNSITMKGAHIGVSDEWVEGKVREAMQGEDPGATNRQTVWVVTDIVENAGATVGITFRKVTLPAGAELGSETETFELYYDA